jgi:calcium/calmodulin-dependent protein kinase I
MVNLCMSLLSPSSKLPAQVLITRSDIWAIGVITYFLLCGYTPFDRDSNLEEMQAILVADYSFTPIEYWRGVSNTARDFIRRCLTTDPHSRMTAHEALNHPWIKEEEEPKEEKKEGSEKVDLLPTVRKNFNARVKLHAAIDTIRAINQLRAGQGAAQMNGAQSREPVRGAPGPPVPAQPKSDEMEGVEGTGQLGSEGGQAQEAEKMDIDSRGHGRGQTEEQIKEQERKIRETMQGLWGKR